MTVFVKYFVTYNFIYLKLYVTITTMSKHVREFDQNIVNALSELDWPLFNNEGRKVFVRSVARNESGFEHIAGKNHYLKVRDILLIPKILKEPLYIGHEKKGKKTKFYCGLRKGFEKSKYLRIIVRIQKDLTEQIVTIYPNKTLK